MTLFCGVIESQSEQDWTHTDGALLQALCDLLKCPKELIEKNRYAAECVLKDREAEKKDIRSWGKPCSTVI